ncbi:hypothetical protein [Sphingomonas sp. GB1N7]|uniref:hypothetical protein n=1 Tax=Parasphingomonas caseinilytica TaxID=3096158 RepID=UPI002FCAD6B9
MKTIHLDGSNWTKRLDFWNALRDVLGVVPAHGTNFGAFEDSVFYHPDMLTVRPPFTLIVRNPGPVASADVEVMAAGWAEQREWKQRHYGEDVAAVIAIER